MSSKMHFYFHILSMNLTMSKSTASHNFWPGCSHAVVFIASVYTSKFGE